MKASFLFLMSLVVLLYNSTVAQIPPYISQQGFIADSNGIPVTGNYHLEFKFYSDSIGGSALLTVDQPSVNVQGGIYNTTLDVSSLPFDGPYWMETNVNGHTMSPRIFLASVPYSMKSISIQGPGSIATGTGSSAGGTNNRVRGDYSFIGGGGGLPADSNSIIGYGSGIFGGSRNKVYADHSFIIGGDSNYITGAYSVIGGGKDNIVNGNYSFAAGRRAVANHSGSFVWADSSDADFASTQPNQFNVRAGNGVRLASDAGAAKTISIGEHYRDNGIVAWGKVAADGSIPATAKFGVASVVRNSAGNYTVTLNVTALDHSLIVVANAEIDAAPTGASTARVVMVNQLAARNNFDVYIMNGTYTMVDNDFVFIVTAR